ncbi:hypothetical protein [Microbacterium sp. Leaf320]|uniref:hypothetical protein n=1 Tax=Microbacterium sp. Leaf320 TaxID=1736334 RepID=UPI0006FBD816|nr:hypothetical protein [Microbacterium sp. Leaf320]KQQ65395.1 hypothetical protein ASF63_15785 [Microbacterium sp. Leaf320]
MSGYLLLRERRFEVSTAMVVLGTAAAGVEIETHAQNIDGEWWAPGLYHQGLAVPTEERAALTGLRFSWGHHSDADYAHPESAFMYVFGHHDVFDAELRFGQLVDGRIAIEWDGLCDVYWDEEFMEAVPFECRCLASIRV